MSECWKKCKGVFWYGFFGVCTTIVNVAAYGLCRSKIGLGVLEATAVAWAAAILFAFFTNRKYVFQSSASTGIEKAGEFLRFAASRLLTGLLDMGGMFLLADRMQLDGVAVKAGMNVFVIVLNYVASKMLVFK